MKGMRLSTLALVALLALTGCMSDSAAEVRIESPTADPVQGPRYFSIARSTGAPQVSEVDTWTIEPGDLGFNLVLSSAITGLSVRLSEISYEVEPGAYSITGIEAEGMITADVLGAEEAPLYHATSGTLTVVQADEILEGSFEFTADPLPGQTVPEGPVTVSGAFEGVETVPTSALD